jgi:uncharacterized protein (DUF1810 family)
MDDPFGLQRFLDAQAPVIEQVRRELRDGRKRSHWMWFVFPQIAGLGFSAMSQRYAIASRAEAAAYLAHPVLGARLLDCTALVNAAQGATARDILGSPDDMKFCSSMALFAAVDPGREEFAEALRKYFGGQPDAATLAKL